MHLPGEQFKQTLLFEGGDSGGTTIIVPIAINVEEKGISWFGIYLDDRLITKVPLRVEISA